MKTKLFKNGLIIFAFFSFCMFSCEDSEKNQGSELEEEQTLETVSVGENESDDALEVVYLAEKDIESSGGRIASNLCAVITHDEVNKTITIDFGDGCTGPYGRERRGKIIIQYSSEIGDSLANRIITFEDYFVNNRGISGTIELRDISVNEDGYLQSTKRLIDLKITFPNGESITLNGSRTREWMEGRGDDDPSNNVYRLTGSVNGISTTGRTFTHEIVEPIIADWSCAAQGNFARISGVVEMTKLGGYINRKRRVEYGDGTCDNVIRIVTFRRSYTIMVSN